MPIRVLVAEDHPIVRSGIQLLLQSEPDIVVSAQASNGLEAIESVMQDPPDLVLMDISMPELGGSTRPGRSAKACPTCPSWC